MINKYKVIFLFLVVILLPYNKSEAGIYDNAKTYESTFGTSESIPARLNADDGYIYFCSRGSTAISSTKYKTIGYKITLSINGMTDYIEVKLGGSFVKDVSEVKSNGYTYVLRRAKLSKLQSLFYGNTNITWNQIYRQKNTYRFDAIMTIEEYGKVKCGNIFESNDNRRISADKNKYLYRTAAAIKSAAKWNNPNDLDNFYAKNICFPPISYINVSPIDITAGDNRYDNNGICYIRKNSKIELSFSSYFSDMDAASKRYHPNFNIYHVSGWGDNQKYTVKQYVSSDASNKQANLIYDESSTSKPLRLNGVVGTGTTNYNTCTHSFYSQLSFEMTAADGKSITVTPEGRCYYNFYYPDSLEDILDLCDRKISYEGKITMTSDGKAPEIIVDQRIAGYGIKNIPVSVNDNCSGIKHIFLYRNDGTMISHLEYSDYVTLVKSDELFYLPANNNYTYYICAYDNVGNVAYSDWFSVNTPVAHTITASTSGGVNGYNQSCLTANVYGGTSTINSFVIMSENDENPTGSRYVLVNNDTENNSLPSGLRKYTFTTNPMKYIQGMPDGRYYFNVISGSRSLASEPASCIVNKDTTKPSIKCIRYSSSTSEWFRSAQRIMMSVEDNYSGISSCELNCNDRKLFGTAVKGNDTFKKRENYTISTEGTNNIKIIAQDIAGNKNESLNVIKIDTKPPEFIMPSALYAFNNDDDQWIAPDKLNSVITILDYTSGLPKKSDALMLLVKSDSGYKQIETEKVFTVANIDDSKMELAFNDSYIKNIESSKCCYYLDIIDVAGNSMRKTLNINVDCDAPRKASEDSTWDSKLLKGNIFIRDAHSGILSIALKRDEKQMNFWDNINKKEFKTTIDLSKYAGDTQKVTLVATDLVGNQREIVLPVTNEAVSLNASIYRKDNFESVIFKAGETGILDIKVNGYAEKIGYYFPYALLTYSHDMNKIIKLTPSKFFVGKYEFTIPFLTNNGDYNITVIAYKGKTRVISTPLFIIDGNVSDEFRTRIR